MTFSNSEGEYYLEEIPDNEYLFHVNHPNYHHYFYENVEHWQQATPILLEDSISINIDVTLNARDGHLITGHVFDSNNNEPMQGILIKASRQNHNCSNTSENFTTMTNNSGVYQLDVPVGTYRMVAINPMNYDVQFYDHVASPINADWLHVTHDFYNIDFHLNDQPPGNYSISGNITIGGEQPIDPILAVAVSSDEDWDEATISDYNGDYEIPGLPEGDYYVFAFSDFAAPTYYENTVNYENAVVVNLDSDVNGIDIDMESPEESGYYETTGSVIDQTGNPVNNATVIFIDNEGNVNDFAQTDETGYYNSDVLANEDYTAVATKVFYNSTTVEFPVDGDQTQDFVIYDEDLGTTEETIEGYADMIEINTYPNPLKISNYGFCKIKFDLPDNTNKAQMFIYNIKGQRVFSSIMRNLSSGEHLFEWNMNNYQNNKVSSGIYFIKIISNKYYGTEKMIMVK